MTVERGRDWGGPGSVPADAVVVASNAALRAVITSARRADRPIPHVALVGGDLCRTLGGRGEAVPGGTGTRVVVDIGSVLLDGRLHWFAAHLVARSPGGMGRWWVAANAAHHGRWNLAPRAHPGDGLLDVLDGALRPAAKIAAWRRLVRGDHVPHPDIGYRRVPAVQTTFDRPLTVRLDGEVVGRFRNLSVRIEPEVLCLAV
jgi:hypothetical protein|tara:strand:+ start:2031 stop:2636 length:606 start_codon:yes stop_codon:yes gene_type:complete